MDAATAATTTTSTTTNNNLFGNMEQKFDLAALLRNVAAAAAATSSNNNGNGTVSMVATTVPGSTATSPNSVDSSAPSSSTTLNDGHQNHHHLLGNGDSLSLIAECSGTGGGSSSRSSTPSTNTTLNQQTPQNLKERRQRRSPIPALSLAPPGVVKRHELPFTPVQPIYAPSGHGRQILIYDSRSHPGRRREFAYKTRFTNQSGLTTVYYRCMACRALRHRLQRTLSKDRLPAVPCIAVKNDLLINDPDFPDASDHFCSPLTIGESNQRLKNTFERGHKRARMKMANSAVEETIRKVGMLRAAKSEIPMEEGNNELLNGNNVAIKNDIDNNEGRDSPIVDVINNIKEDDDNTLNKQLICELNLLKNNNPEIILKKEENPNNLFVPQNTPKYLFNRQHSPKQLNQNILQHSIQTLSNNNLISEGLLTPKLMNNNSGHYPIPNNSPNIFLGNNGNNNEKGNNLCNTPDYFNLGSPMLSAVLFSAAATMIRNNHQATQNQVQQQNQNNFQETINNNFVNNNNNYLATPNIPVQNNLFKRKGAIVNGILQKLSNKATAEAHNNNNNNITSPITSQPQKTPLEINNDLEKIIKTKL
uniref:Uncharacterized protein n=1 Tax=Meloidogyne enterolobii TaxID=390850 RepID=A0A6V7V0F2_MELEN|nr:unnamed protein product [Meloidogyne enterolobii]